MLDIIFLLLAIGLVYRFVRTDGMPMLKMMGGSPDNSTTETTTTMTINDDRHHASR